MPFLKKGPEYEGSSEHLYRLSQRDKAPFVIHYGVKDAWEDVIYCFDVEELNKNIDGLISMNAEYIAAYDTTKVKLKWTRTVVIGQGPLGPIEEEEDRSMTFHVGDIFYAERNSSGKYTVLRNLMRYYAGEK